jgi:hypothetical protein
MLKRHLSMEYTPQVLRNDILDARQNLRFALVSIFIGRKCRTQIRHHLGFQIYQRVRP